MKICDITWLSHGVYSHKTTLIDLMIIMLMGSISLSWFRGDYIIKTGDDFFPLDPAYASFLTSYLWVHYTSTGLPNDPLALTNIPLFILIASANTIGLHIVILQKLFYYALFTTSGISAYLFTTSLLPKNKRVTGLSSAFFYMMNPYSLSVIWFAHYTTLLLSYSIAPLLLMLYVKGINAKAKENYIVLMSLMQPLVSAIFCDPAQTLIILILASAFFILYIFVNKKEKAKLIGILRFNLLLMISLFAINSWWILPFFYLYHIRLSRALYAYSSEGVFISGSTSSTILNTLRLLGFYFIWAKWYPVSIYAWTETYSSPVFVFISCLIPVFAFSQLILKPQNKYVLFFALLSVLGIFLSKGASEPLGSINIWLFRNLPFAVVFRTHFIRFAFIIVLGYTFLIGLTFSELWERHKIARLTPIMLNKFRKVRIFRITSMKLTISVIILLVAMASFVIYNYPFWTGDVIYPGSQYLPSARIQVPSYYVNAGNYINAQFEEFRILDIPPRLSGTSAYSWEHGYIASDPIDQYYFHKPLIGIGDIPPFDRYFFSIFSRNQSSLALVNLLSLLNIKYILIHRDWNTNLISWYEPSPQSITKFLNSAEGIYLEKSFGKLDLYRNRYWKELHIYTTTNAILVQGSLEEMFSVIERENFVVGDYVLFLSDQLTPSQLSQLANLSITIVKYYPNPIKTNITKESMRPNGVRGPLIVYEQINPTKYFVHVINASQPFFLIFSESFDKNWIAYVDGRQLTNDQHFIVNGFANAWFVNRIGTYTITLEFWPQKLFYIGSAISITTLILCILYISKNKIKNLYHQYIKKARAVKRML